MERSVRFRTNAQGLQWFNPTNREWVELKTNSDILELGKLLSNVTKTWPVGDEARSS